MIKLNPLEITVIKELRRKPFIKSLRINSKFLTGLTTKNQKLIAALFGAKEE